MPTGKPLVLGGRWIVTMTDVSENRLRDRQDGMNLPDDRRSVLRPTLISRYQTELHRKRSDRQRERQSGIAAWIDLQRMAHVLWSISAILAVALLWRLVVYALDLHSYVRFATSGVTTQATVLGKRTERSASNFRPDRLVVTYGFWSDDTGTINRKEVGRPLFDALVVDDPLTIVYLPDDLEASAIRSELTLPWPVGVVVLLGCCLALAYAGLTLARRPAYLEPGTGP